MNISDLKLEQYQDLAIESCQHLSSDPVCRAKEDIKNLENILDTVIDILLADTDLAIYQKDKIFDIYSKGLIVRQLKFWKLNAKKREKMQKSGRSFLYISKTSNRFNVQI